MLDTKVLDMCGVGISMSPERPQGFPKLGLLGFPSIGFS